MKPKGFFFFLCFRGSAGGQFPRRGRSRGLQEPDGSCPTTDHGNPAPSFNLQHVTFNLFHLTTTSSWLFGYKTPCQRGYFGKTLRRQKSSRA